MPKAMHYSVDGADKSAREKPSDLDGAGYSDASYRPGYSLDTSLPETSEDELKAGLKKGG